MQAAEPDVSGYLDRGGVQVYYESYGTAGPVILLLPGWEILHSRSWKFQIPYLARHGQVVTFDPRGNGRSDRPPDAAAYNRREFAADALAVLDAVGAPAAVVVAWCGARRGTPADGRGASRAGQLAGPDRARPAGDR